MSVRPRSFVLGLVAVVLAVAVPPARAHGVLERSLPSANTVIESAPERIVLWFSEPVDPLFSRAVLTDAGGTRRGGSPVVSANRRQITVAAGALPRGVYTVTWRVLSTSDGHITTGAFAFAIGTALPAGAAPVPAAFPGPARVVTRWLSFLAMVALAGSVLFEAAVLRPAVRGLSAQRAPRLPGPLDHALSRLGRGAAIGLLVGLVFEFGAASAALLDAPGGIAALDAAPAFLAGTKPGWSLLVRAGLAAALLALLSTRPRRTGTHTAVLLAAALPAGFTLASHAAGAGAVAVVADWLHALAVAVWIGGLPSLLVALRTPSDLDRPLLSRALVGRFSTLAAFSLGVVVLTGVFSARLHVPDAAAVLATPYGRTLLAKVAFAIVLIGLGGATRVIVHRRVLRNPDASAPARRFLRLSIGEVSAAAIILLVAAALTLTPPATSARLGGQPARVLLAGIAGDMKVGLTIAPAVPGWNRLEVTTRGADGSSVEVPDRVLVRLTKLDEPLDLKTIVLMPVAPGRFAAEGGDLVAEGWWQVGVVVRRASRPDVSTTFPLMLERPVIECRPPEAFGPDDPDALTLLSDARVAWSRVRTWREVQQLTDGAGSVYLTWVEAESPDRQHFRTSTGVEVVALGAVRYQRSGGGPWKRYEFASPVPVEGPIYFLRGARDVRLGRTGQCEGEPCRVLFWASPDRGAKFAAWVITGTARIHRLLMLEPTHYMTLQYADLNAPIRIREPR
ncbi:MAG: copper resistance protein CopC [Armatimonadota bacterium]|nr:copper resistance protein CopC [Armatimonadota bacterium]